MNAHLVKDVAVAIQVNATKKRGRTNVAGVVDAGQREDAFTRDRGATAVGFGILDAGIDSQHKAISQRESRV